VSEQENSPCGVLAGIPRVLGRHDSGIQGPLLITIGGIHGNEPAGVRAIQSVIAQLQSESIPIRGSFLGLTGNISALARNTRYQHRDLNRAWTPEVLDRIESEGPGDAEEDHEQLELLRALRTEIDKTEGNEIFFLDLHTSSAKGIPFACVGDTLRNRRFARLFPVPVLLGLEEQLDGALLEYLNNHGIVTLGFEGGQHSLPSSRERLEAALWTGMASAGLIPRSHPRVIHGRSLLREASQGIPRVLEIRYRHGIHPSDGFRMLPGFHNFDRVRPGQPLARNRHGEIRAHYSARILLPLYQGVGDDGFFLAREISPIWLKLSTFLRRMRCDRIVQLLPGVERHSRDSEALWVDRRVAR